MTTKSRIAGSLLALGTAFVAVPLTAEQPLIVEGQPEFRERISIADLDLRQWGEQQTLYRRVRHASERVCLQAEGPLPQIAPGFGPERSRMNCAQLTYHDARPQMAAAIEQARAGTNVATALVITAPVRAR